MNQITFCSSCINNTQSSYSLLQICEFLSFKFIVSRLSAGRGLEEEWNPINPKSTFLFHIRSTAENDSTSLEFVQLHLSKASRTKV